MLADLGQHGVLQLSGEHNASTSPAAVFGTLNDVICEWLAAGGRTPGNVERGSYFLVYRISRILHENRIRNLHKEASGYDYLKPCTDDSDSANSFCEAPPTGMTRLSPCGVLELTSKQSAREAVWPLVLRCRRRGQQVIRPVGIALQTKGSSMLDTASATKFSTVRDRGCARRLRCMAPFIVSTGWGCWCCRDEPYRAGDAKRGDLRCGQDRRPTWLNPKP